MYQLFVAFVDTSAEDSQVSWKLLHVDQSHSEVRERVM